MQRKGMRIYIHILCIHIYIYISHCCMYNSKNHRNHNRSSFPSVLNHRRWSTVAPVATDEKWPSLDSCPSHWPKLLVLQHLALSPFTKEGMTPEQMQSQTIRGKRAKKRKRLLATTIMLFQEASAGCPWSSLAQFQNSVNDNTDGRRDAGVNFCPRLRSNRFCL